jgi:hypothetical protein
MKSQSRLLHIGRHVIEEEDSLLHVRWRGNHTLAEQHQIYDHISEYLRVHGTGLLLIDLSQAGSLSAEQRHAEQRHASGDWWRKQQLDTIALAHYGQTLANRLMLGLLARAVSLVSRSAVLTENFATEAEARAWLAMMKNRLRSRETTTP